jgi:UDP-N-acetylglucosamine 1-carboxyvinyltransferase
MGAGIRISGATGPKARIGMVMERRPAGVEIDTGPYPGFPTDLQSVFLAVEAAGSGESRFKETVYEARFEAAMRLAAFGADVSLHKDTAIIRGRYPLVPGIAETPDLRGGAALLVAALAADGLSVISDSGHLKRGYEDIGRDLRKLGADIEEDEL